MADLEAKLFNTCVSPQWLSEVLQDNLPSKAEKIALVGFEAEKIGIGAGFLSHILRVRLDWSKKSIDIDLPDYVIIKAPTTDKIHDKLDDFGVPEDMQEIIIEGMKNDLLKRYLKAECDLYKLVAETENKMGISVPKCFYFRDTGDSETGVLVLENLSKSAGLMNFYDGLRMPQVFAVVKEIASLHAYCLKNEEWKGRFKLMPEHHFAEWPKYYERNMGVLTATGHTDIVKQMQKLKHHFDSKSILKTVTSHVELGLPEMIVHGDTWAHNLLFKRKSTTDPEITDQLSAIIDWQMLHIGNLAEDLAVLLISSVKAETRRSETQNVLRFYYETLAAKMEATPIPYTLKDVQVAYNRIFSFGVGLFLLFWITLMGAGENVQGPQGEERVKEVMARAKALVDDLTLIDEAWTKGGEYEWP